MNNNEYLTLVYCGRYIDVNLLERGIYFSKRPFIYEKGTTIDMLCDKYLEMVGSLGMVFDVDSYINNLRSCELVRIGIVFIG
jgi:hypothetical protein